MGSKLQQLNGTLAVALVRVAWKSKKHRTRIQGYAGECQQGDDRGIIVDMSPEPKGNPSVLDTVLLQKSR